MRNIYLVSMSHPPPGILDMYKTDVVVTPSNKLGLMLGGHTKTSKNMKKKTHTNKQTSTN